MKADIKFWQFVVIAAAIIVPTGAYLHAIGVF